MVPDRLITPDAVSVPTSVLEDNPNATQKISEHDFARQVEELGGIPAALAAGIDPWVLPDGDVRSVWLEMCRCWEQLMDLSAEAVEALAWARTHP